MMFAVPHLVEAQNVEMLGELEITLQRERRIGAGGTGYAAVAVLNATARSGIELCFNWATSAFDARRQRWSLSAKGRLTGNLWAASAHRGRSSCDESRRRGRRGVRNQ